MFIHVKKFQRKLFIKKECDILTNQSIYFYRRANIYKNMDMVEYIKGTLHSCVCGYNTLSSKHACKHSKTKKCSGKTMEKRDVEFVSKEYFQREKPSEMVLQECLQREKALLDEREVNLRTMTQLQNTIDRLKSSLEKMVKSVDIIDTEDDFYDTQHNGLIYFIIDKDVQGRGKIGRTKNTNVNKLKTRYSTFGNPSILCFLSADIKSDENALKKLMRDAGCMETNKEMISNCEVARGVFYEFMTSRMP